LPERLDFRGEGLESLLRRIPKCVVFHRLSLAAKRAAAEFGLDAAA
jgi:hypothetical protein